jgi:probable HAF family extracellular repeat protein
MKSNRSKSTLLLIVLAMMATMSHSAFAQQYDVTDLGTLGGDKSMAYALNNTGQVIGTSTTSDGTFRPFFWHSGMMTDLRDLGAAFHGVTDINDDGQIIGNVFISSGIDRAFIWGPSEGMRDLGVLSGKTKSWAYGMNDHAQVVGGSASIGDTRPFLSDSINGIQDLGLLPGTTQGIAGDINNSGEVVGSCTRIPFLWNDARGLQVLETLAGTDSIAIAINDHGQIAGNSYTAEGFIHACLWDEFHRVHDLGTLPGRKTSSALGINNYGDVVGSSMEWPQSDQHVFLWTVGAMHDLNSYLPPDSSWELLVAKDINDAGQIVGWGRVDLDGDGTFDETHAFVLTPVAEVNAAVSP